MYMYICMCIYIYINMYLYISQHFPNGNNQRLEFLLE